MNNLKRPFIFQINLVFAFAIPGSVLKHLGEFWKFRFLAKKKIHVFSRRRGAVSMP